MNPARRTLSYWILATLVERGCDPFSVFRRHRRQPLRSVRALTPPELAELRRRTLKVRFLPRRRPGGEGG